MATRFVTVDRNTPLLLPPDLRDWVPADHIVHFILEAVEQVRTEGFVVNTRGTGDPQYPPRMMLGLLIYGYATGRSGSRQIEAATSSDVAVRYLTGNTHPDHDTICTFRRENRPGVEAAFVQVLQLARELKLTKVGTVSVDGTKVLANASKHAAVSYGKAGEMIEQLQLEVQELLARAEREDRADQPTGLNIPQELQRRQDRIEALKAAREAIEARARQKPAAAPAGQEKPGEPDPKAQYNFTDPESRIMKAGGKGNFEQAYNAQAAVDQNLLIVGQRVSPKTNDKEELAPTVAAISPVVAAEVQVVLADSGFYSEAAVQAVEQRPDGTASGRQVYAAVGRQSHHKTVAELFPQPEPPAPGPQASAAERMAHRLKTEMGKALYKLRKQTVEPVFGIIKEVMGFRRFRLRGLEKVELEWTLVSVSYNLKRLFVLQKQAAQG
jgi:transposase